MTWPTVAVNTTNVDAGTDNPASARADILDAIQKLNQMIAMTPLFNGGAVVGTTGAFSGAVSASSFAGPLTGNVTGSCSGSAGSISGGVAIGTGVTAWSSGGTLSAANGLNYINSGSAITLTLPNAPAPGTSISLYNLNQGECTLARGGSSTIYALGLQAMTSVLIQRGMGMTLVYDGFSWIQVAGLGGVGWGQKQYDVTGARALNTTFYNTSGQPIVVYATAYGNNVSSPGMIGAVVDGTLVGQQWTSDGTTSWGGARGCLTFVVPPHKSYYVWEYGGGSTLYKWIEMGP